MCDIEDRNDSSEHAVGAEGDLPIAGVEALTLAAATAFKLDFQLPTGFAQSLLPDIEDVVAKTLVSLQSQLKVTFPDVLSHSLDVMGPLNWNLQKQLNSTFPDYASLIKKTFRPYNELVWSKLASVVASLPTFTTPMIDFPALKGFEVSPVIESILQQITDQQSAIFERLRDSLKPLFAPELLRGLNRTLLPPNLRDHADEIQSSQVHQFVEQEGIPLYLVPRGRTALRLLRAQDRSARRRVLGDCYESIIEDCATVLERIDPTLVGDEMGFALDGLGAMRAGYPRSAQAMFTVTLDTLIYRFFPDQSARRLITNRRKGANVPNIIDEMGVHEAMVWLPIWNAHEQFWKHKGDKEPRYYSRHASVHGVSSRQFSKRNCVQALMLVTSLLGYAERFPPSSARAEC